MFQLLTRLGVDTAGYDRWQLIFAGAASRLTWVLAAAVALAAILWTWSSVRELNSGPRRLALAALQLITLAFIVAVMFQPAIRLAKVARIKDRITVLIDTSASMSLPAGDKKTTRADAAADFVSGHEGFFRKLEDEFTVAYFGFDTDQLEIAGRPAAPLPSAGTGTDLMAALSAASAGGSPPAGLVVVSDGADTSRLGQNYRADPAAGVGPVLAGFPAPVNTVAIGEAGAVKDLAIVRVTHDDYGFVHNPFAVEVEIHSEGDLVPEVPVVFKQGDRLLASKTIPLAPGQTSATATLSFTPRQVGEFMFTLEIPVAAGELTDANNVYHFPLKVLRDKVRILYLVGNPSWDERFLRQTLKKNPIVDLVCFYILRELWDNPQAGEKEISLIRFPTHQLFTEELDTFDLLIWQNFYGPEYMEGQYANYMKEVNRFVRERGGAVLMIGGVRGFWGQGMLDPLLLDVLPVEPADPVPNYLEGEFKPELTPAGLRHPIMQIADEGDDLAAVWAGLPALSAYNPVLRARPDALVLAAHPATAGSADKSPLIAVREVGAGRVMTVMTDRTWEWSLPAAGEGRSSRPYQRFWENSLRWLLKDPELRLITFTADHGHVEPGKPVTLSLEVLDETYNPTDDAELKVEALEQPAGAELAIPAPERYALGKYRLTVTPASAGVYRLRATGKLQGRSLGEAEVNFEASATSVEWIDVLPRPGLLAEVSKATNGMAITADGDPGGFVFHRSAAEQIAGARDLPVWDNPFVFMIGFGLMVVGWFFRRRWGLR
jgi:uncharacterized membrane protein